MNDNYQASRKKYIIKTMLRYIYIYIYIYIFYLLLAKTIQIDYSNREETDIISDDSTPLTKKKWFLTHVQYTFIEFHDI